METLEQRIKTLEKKVRFNWWFLFAWCLGVGGLAIGVAIPFGRSLPLPKGKAIEIISSAGNWVRLHSQALTFFNGDNETIASIDVSEEDAPKLELRGGQTTARFGVFKEGGGELFIQKSATAGEDWHGRAWMKVLPQENDVSLSLFSSGYGEVSLGISNRGEPELVLAQEKGGMIEIRVRSDGMPLLRMLDGEGNVVLEEPAGN